MVITHKISKSQGVELPSPNKIRLPLKTQCWQYEIAVLAFKKSSWLEMYDKF